MDIVLIGSGNVATVLGRLSLARGHRILQVYSRNAHHAHHLAARLGASSTTDVSSIKEAELMIIALRDEFIKPFAHSMGSFPSLVVHTAGAIPIQEIAGLSASYGALYPLQSLRKEIEIIPTFPLLIQGNNPETGNRIRAFALSLSGIVLETDDETRLRYHLAATLVNNFTNYLYTETASFCEKENISFAVLQPIMEETITRLRTNPPHQVQTGPAIRNDQITLDKHRRLLRKYPSILKLYDLFTEGISNHHRRLKN